MTKFICACAALLSASALASPPSLPAAPPAPPPRLIVAISVDQLSANLFDEYRPHFTGGLARLATGAVFRNGYQAHAATETCPGHSTILTGTHPARNGIIANSWYDMELEREDKQVYCAEDERVPGTSSREYRLSPVHLKVPTLGDLLKRLSPASQSVAVAGKDRAAVMMGGHKPDQRWYWANKAFRTDLTQAPVPKTAAAANTAVQAMIAAPQAGLEPPPLCATRARQVAVGDSTVGAGTFERPAGDEAMFRASPALDGAVLALAAGLVQEMRLGRDIAPDVLAISLSATDYVGHRYGTRGQEMCLQLLSLDRNLGDFFQLLDRSGIDYSVVLTADHGAADIPERARLGPLPAALRADPALEAKAVGKRIGAKLGLGGDVLAGDIAGDIYIGPSVPPAKRQAVLAEALAIYRSHPQVEAAFSAAELSRIRIPQTPPDRWSLAERARASFDPDRSGDIVVLTKSFVTPIPEPSPTYIAAHGSPWDHDRRVPIIFWRPGMAPANPEQAVAAVDIMPTLAASLGIPLEPGSIDGKCLEGVPGVVCSRR